MNIKDWPINDLNTLASVYNTQIASQVPHCFVVTPEELQNGCYQKTGDDFASTFHTERIIVGLHNHKIKGFAHIRVGEIKHGDLQLRGGFIHFFTYAIGYREIGHAILKKCDEHFRETNVQNIRVFDGYFYRFHHLGFPLVSDRMAHIYGLLGMDGYRLAGKGEIFLEHIDYPVHDPIIPDSVVEVRVQSKLGRGVLPNINVKVFMKNVEIGSCIAFSGCDFSLSHKAQHLIFIDGLGVAEKYQGQSWGRYLLLRTLWEAQQLGYHHTVISTGKHNYRAQVFYTNYGYRITDTVYGFTKELPK